MSTLLSIHTAADICCVALLKNGETRELRETRPRAHAERLAPLIREIGATDTLDGVVVAAGPGSYTGLRIGVSAAKGLAWSRDVPLYAVSTLRGFALSALEHQPGTPVLSMIPARRSEWYVGLYDPDGHSKADDRAIEAEKLQGWAAEYVTGDVTITGPFGVEDHPIPVSREPGGATFVRADPTAISLIACVLEDPESTRVRDLSRFEPYYLKPFVAKKPKGSIFDRLSF